MRPRFQGIRRGPWNGTVWRSFVKLRQTRKDLSMYTIRTDTGIGIIRRGKQPLLKIDGELTFETLAKNRTRLLNLVSENEFKTLEENRKNGHEQT